MSQEIIVFVVKHWMLVSAFVMVFILLLLEEAKSQSGGADQLSAMAATQLINHENAVVIDTRDANAFLDAHIIGAKNISSSELEQDVKKLESHRAQPIILVDAMGTKVGVLASRLKKAGFEKVKILKGGISAWKEAGMPVVKGHKQKG